MPICVVDVSSKDHIVHAALPRSSIGSTPRFIVVVLVAIVVVLVAIRPLLVGLVGADLLFFEVAIAAIVSAVFQFRAASGFDRGEHLRRAYLYQAWSSLMVTVFVILPPATSPAAHLLAAAIILVVNVGSVIGTWMFSRAFAAAGLELPGSRARKLAVVAVFGGGAIVFAGGPMAQSAAALAGGDLAQLTALISFAGDLVIFVLIGPLFLTALALRGGLLVWPWALFTAAGACWIITDALGLILPLSSGVGADASQHWLNLWPVMAYLLAAAAAHAQRALIRARPVRGRHRTAAR